MARKNKSVLMDGLIALAGFALSKQVNRIAFVQTNPLIGGGVKIAAGLALSGMKQKNLAPAGMGMIVGGGADLVGALVPSLSIAGLPAGVGFIPNANPHVILNEDVFVNVQ